MTIQYYPQNCKKIIHKIDNRRLPFNWGINPYRGCFHSCVYCFARYTHSYLNLDPTEEFEKIIFVKQNAPTILRKEFSNPKWKKEVVNLGSVCDPYQPIERSYRISRELLKVFLQYRNPITIATKSDLILRDIDILTQLNEQTTIDVVVSISTVNESLRKQIEPRTISTDTRLKLVKQLLNSKLRVGVLLMPIIPFLNDSPGELKELFHSVADAKASYVIPGVLSLLGPSKVRFFNFIKAYYPHLRDKLMQFYTNKSPPIKYREKLHAIFRENIQANYLNTMPTRDFVSNNNSQNTIDQWCEK